MRPRVVFAVASLVTALVAGCGWAEPPSLPPPVPLGWTTHESKTLDYPYVAISVPPGWRALDAEGRDLLALAGPTDRDGAVSIEAHPRAPTDGDAWVGWMVAQKSWPGFTLDERVALPGGDARRGVIDLGVAGRFTCYAFAPRDGTVIVVTFEELQGQSTPIQAIVESFRFIGAT